ncbi:MAG: NIPSNAP family protein [Verrucomicrobiota bacterium]|jgi:hypothetical protein
MKLRPALRFVIVLLLPLAMASMPAPVSAADDDQPQYYELRTYLTKSTDQQQRVSDYWQNAAIPAYNRMGIQPVGVFTEIKDSSTNNIYVIIPFDSLEAFGSVPAKLAADPIYQAEAAGFLDAPKTNAAYVRFASSLLVAFNGMKHMALPPADKKPNVFELRTYISSSDSKGWSKIKMFESGEIALMKQVGLAPIFYSRTVIGPNMPCLVYLTSGENMEAHSQHWQGFNDAPIWKALQADPQYKDNVSSIIRILLKRTPASQI